MKENMYQAQLIRKLNRKFRGCLILKNDSSYRPGIPDLLVLYRDKWCALEVKASEDSPDQPNQAYYIDLLDDMSYAAFISPENESEVLDDLRQTFKSRR